MAGLARWTTPLAWLLLIVALGACALVSRSHWHGRTAINAMIRERSIETARRRCRTIRARAMRPRGISNARSIRRSREAFHRRAVVDGLRSSRRTRGSRSATHISRAGIKASRDRR